MQVAKAFFLQHQVQSTLQQHFAGHASSPCSLQHNISSIQESWRFQKTHPAFNGHSVLSSTPSFQRKMVPLARHGDGTPVIGIGKIWSRQLTFFAFNSLLGRGATKDMQIHLWSSFDECCCPTTMDEYFTILSWSFQALQKGKWPESNHLGQKYSPNTHEGKLADSLLADGYSAIVWSLVGDLEYMNSVLKLPHYSNKTNPCALCRCPGGSDDNSWKDCRLSANWLSLQWQPSELLWWNSSWVGNMFVFFCCLLVQHFENLIAWFNFDGFFQQY